MFDKFQRYSIIYDNNGSYTEYTNNLCSYDEKDSMTITLDKDTGYLYVGLFKPFNCVYVELGTANTNAGVFSGEFYNGTEWTSIDDLIDDTKSFTRSGYIQWDRELTDWGSVEVNSVDKYWIRLRPSVTHSETVVYGINVIFADDYDLKKEFPKIDDSMFLLDRSDHILIHESVRDDIIQKFRLDGKFKVDEDGYYDKIIGADIHDITEVKKAATYLALSKIFFNVSDSQEDSWYTMSKDFNQKYETMLNTSLVSLDLDDEGDIDDIEKSEGFQTVRIER